MLHARDQIEIQEDDDLREIMQRLLPLLPEQKIAKESIEQSSGYTLN
jgi:hypothetical protein